MRSYHCQAHVQAREGVELWELGETLGVGEGVLPSVPPSSTRPFASSSGGSETSSSGSSCSSSSSVRRIPLHAALSAPSHGGSLTPWEEDGGGGSYEGDEGENEIMSLRERDAHFDSLRQGLTRSRSFGGLLMTPNSGRRSLGGGTLRSGWAGMGVLGQGAPPSPRDLRRQGSLPPHVKVPKTPRPQRASLVAGVVAKGVRDCVSVTRKDLFVLTRAQHDYKRAKSQGRVYEMEKQMKAAERYLKKLEFLLSQIEDLHDQYSLNQRLREGVRTMAYAYALSPGKDKASALSNVRSGYRECTETLCNLEVQIEQLIGTFTMEMKGIQGFARLCPGDVFEVSIKHGSQKWKTKGRVAKDSSQLWDNPVRVFKALIGEMLLIKAMEVRILGKTVMIGNKVCETKDLFSPHPQLMTVNLNPSGSLKLNVVITWNPLDGGSEDTLVRTPSISGPSPRVNRRSIIHSLSSSPSRDRTLEILSPECDQDSSFGSMSARSSTTDSASPLSEYRGIPSSQALSTRTDSNSPVSDIQAMGLSRRADSGDSISFDGRDSASPQCDVTSNFTLVRKEESRVEQWARYSLYGTQCNGSQGSGIDLMSRSFPNLSSSHSRSPHSSSQSQSFHPHAQSQLLSQSLSHQLNVLSEAEQDHKWPDSLAWDTTVPSTLPEVVRRLRTCLEDIQGQFPQLHSLEEAVLDLYDMCRRCRSRRDSNTSEISLSVESALECFDFLNAECDDDFADDNPEECMAKNRKESLAALNGKDFIDPPHPLVTGSPQLDAFLLIHLQHSLHLMQNLGSFGPLRRKEMESVSKLEVEGKLLETVLSHRHNFDSLRPQHIMSIPHVQVLWDSVTPGEGWCVSGKEVVKGLYAVVSSLVEPDNKELPIMVLEELVRRMTDSEIYSDCSTVTAGHFLAHLKKPLQDEVPKIAASLNCSALLAQRDPHSVEKGLSQLKSPNLLHTRLICQHYLGPQEFSSLIESFLIRHKQNEEILIPLYDNCLLLLESTSPSDRSNAATFLGYLFPLLPPKVEERRNSLKEKEEKLDLTQVKPCSSKSKGENECDSAPSTCDDLSSHEAQGDQNEGSKQNKVDATKEEEKNADSPVAKIQSPHSPAVTPIYKVPKKGDTTLPFAILSFLQQNDPSQEVRNSARLALLNLGTQGQEALHQVQLSSHGFQGVYVKEGKGSRQS